MNEGELFGARIAQGFQEERRRQNKLIEDALERERKARDQDLLKLEKEAAAAVQHAEEMERWIVRV